MKWHKMSVKPRDLEEVVVWSPLGWLYTGYYSVDSRNWGSTDTAFPLKQRRRCCLWAYIKRPVVKKRRAVRK